MLLRRLGLASRRGFCSGTFADGRLRVADAGAKGRGVFAAQGIEKGSVVLTVEAGAPSSVVLAEQSPKVYVLDPAPARLPTDDEDVLKFPFLSDPRNWPMVCGRPKVAGVGMQAVHEACVSPFLAGQKAGPFLDHGYFNHSCCAQVQRDFPQPSTLRLRALQKIEPGQEIDDSYSFPLVPLHVRRLGHEALGFQCACERCTAEGQLPRTMHVWSELSWGTVMRLLASVARTRSQSGGKTQGLTDDPTLRQVVDQLRGLLGQTEKRLEASAEGRALELCLASWAPCMAALGDLQGLLREPEAYDTMGTAARWSMPVMPSFALQIAARGLLYAAEMEHAPAVQEMASAVNTVHAVCFGGGEAAVGIPALAPFLKEQ